jgi:sulfur carrier protein
LSGSGGKSAIPEANADLSMDSELPDSAGFKCDGGLSAALASQGGKRNINIASLIVSETTIRNDLKQDLSTISPYKLQHAALPMPDISCWQKRGYWQKLQRIPNTVNLKGKRFLPFMESLICIKCDAYDDTSMESMTLEINGEIRTISPVSNVRELLQLLGVTEGRVAVELNRKIIRKGDWEKTPISNMDHVEIVQFVGGG